MDARCTTSKPPARFSTASRTLAATAALLAAACAMFLSPATGEEISTGGEIVRRLWLKLDELTSQLQVKQRQLQRAKEQRDEALQLARDAKEQVDDALGRAERFKSEREAAKKEAANAQEQLRHETAAIRARHEKLVSDMRRRTATEVEAVRREAERDKAAVREQAKADVDAARDDAADARQEAAAYHDELERTKAELESVREELERYRQEERRSQARAAAAYSQGLRHLERRDNWAAIRSFSDAIEEYPKDARFYYLRAVARHFLGGVAHLDEAEEDAHRAAYFEQQSSPSPESIDVALERIQGKTRLWLERFRR